MDRTLTPVLAGNGAASSALTASVVIPSLLGGARLIRLVEDFGLDPCVQVVIADNGLPQSTRRQLRATGADVIEMEGNLGFARAVNKAVGHCEGDALVVTNDDIYPMPGFLHELVRPLTAGADMAAGVLIQASDPTRIDSAGILIDRYAAGYEHLHDRPVAVLEEPVDDPFAPSGGAACYRRSAFVEIGGFDPGLFAYGEDVDLGIRLRRAGSDCVLAAEARALHIGSRTLGYHSLAKARITARSRGYLLRKYGILRGPGRGLQALAIELMAVSVLVARHGSMSPLAERVRGSLSCEVRSAPPNREWAEIGLIEGVARRFRRSRRRTITTSPPTNGGCSPVEEADVPLRPAVE